MALKKEHKIFCQEYIKNGNNGTQAYMIAYPSSNKENARRRASELVTKSDVQEYIKELQGKMEDEAIMSAIERKKWLTQVINGEIKEKVYLEGVEAERDAYLSDKMKALDILNKMSGEYVIKTEVKDITPKWFKKNTN